VFNLRFFKEAEENIAALAVREDLSMTGFSGLFMSALTITGCPLANGSPFGICLFTGDL